MNATLNANAIAEGSILSGNWGWEQTNVTFYRVESRKGDWVSLRPLKAVKTDDGPAAMTGKAIPGEPSGKPLLRRKVQSFEIRRGEREEFVKGGEHDSARLWDGQPKRYSTYA